MTQPLSNAEWIEALGSFSNHMIKLELDARRRGRLAFAALCKETGKQAYWEQLEAGADPRATPGTHYPGSVDAGQPWRQE